ncbi:MAG: IS110 family RNA-guided transposase [Planctomycetota bacterium]|jgi:transposase
MSKRTLFVGLDVHAESISVAVAESKGEARFVGKIPNRIDSIRKLMKKLGLKEELRVCYEAGPCGYVLYWQLTQMGIACEVIAPTLVPVKSGDRVKTDRRDSLKLARNYRSGDLTAVWVPDPAHEALRDLVRAREAAKKDQRKARHRLQKLLLRHDRRPQERMRAWGTKYGAWMRKQKFDYMALQATFQDYHSEVEHTGQRIERLERAIDEAVEQAPSSLREVIAALQALRGVSKTTAIGVVVEVGKFARFDHPRQLMGYSGAVPSESSSGKDPKRGGITKTGNTHVRRLLIEAAWSYRHGPSLYPALKKRQEGLCQQVKDVAWRAQHRLCTRYRRLLGRGKPSQKVVTAVARELLGFMWEIAVHIERQAKKTETAA